jgi:hypothetical protein
MPTTSSTSMQGRMSKLSWCTAVAMGLLVGDGAATTLDPRFGQGQAAYFDGRGLQAGELWQPCAIAGDPRCQYGLGVLFDDGAEEWPRNTATAVLWLRRAARQGHVEAQIRLGFLYAVGRDDLSQDIKESFVWFSLAAAHGSAAARGHRDRVRELMTEEELEAATRLLTSRSIHYRFQDGPPAPRPEAPAAASPSAPE